MNEKSLGSLRLHNIIAKEFITRPLPLARKGKKGLS